MSSGFIQHAVLVLALIGVVLNLLILLRVRPGTPITISLPTAQSGEHDDATRRRDHAVGVPLGLQLPEHLSIVRHRHCCSRLQPVRQRDASEMILGEDEALACEPPPFEGDLLNGDSYVASVDGLDAADPLVPLDDVHGRVANPQSDSVLPDEPHGIEHAERGAQNRNP